MHAAPSRRIKTSRLHDDTSYSQRHNMITIIITIMITIMIIIMIVIIILQ